MAQPVTVIEDHMIDWHVCQTCYALEIKLLLLLLEPAHEIIVLIT